MFLLCYAAAATWWDWNPDQFKKLVKDSIDRPLFVLCYSKFCPHCMGLPEGFQNYHKGMAANRTDIILSMIDCYVDKGCHTFGLRGTPHMALVLGEKKKYWPVSPERGPEGWNRWINERIGPNLRMISTDEELERAIEEPTDGGTTFLLEVPDEGHAYVEQMRTLSKTFRIYNDTFVFRVREGLEKPEIYAYYTKYCKRTFNGSASGIRNFLYDNRFGALHRYDTEEFRELQQRQTNAIIMFVEDKRPTKAQLKALREISRNRCEADITVGWVNIKDDRKVLQGTEVSEADLPVMYRVVTPVGSREIYKGRVRDIWKSDFMSDYVTESVNAAGTFVGQSSWLEWVVKICLFCINTGAIACVAKKYQANSLAKIE